MLIHSLPTTPHTRFFQIAYSLALNSPGVGGKKKNNFRLGSLIINRQNHILSARFNLNKTHPLLSKYFKFPYLHAEAYCILSLGFDNCKNHTLYVARIHRNNHIAMARPCKECLNLCKFVKIKTIYYTTETGYEKINLC